MKNLSAGFALLLAAMFAVPAMAAMPVDCSKGPVPAGPAKGEMLHKPFVPNTASLRISQTMDDGANHFDEFRLQLSKPESNIDDAEADVLVMVKRGSLPAGRSFHLVPGDIDVQPMAMKGTPEVQGWTFSDDATGDKLDSVMSEKKDSLQVNFGPRKGNTIPGTIYLCEPSQGGAWVAGSFDATLTK